MIAVPIYLKTEEKYWPIFAKENSATILRENDQVRPNALMFRQGFSQTFRNPIVFEEDSLRIYEYSFKIQKMYKKDPFPYMYTVFDLPFKGTVPHLVLNFRHDQYKLAEGKELPLPREFEEKFKVYTADQYEIEALEVFTPDVLVLILDNALEIDIELVDGHVLFFVPKHATGFGFRRHLAILEEQYKAIQVLFEKLQPVLTGFSYEKIGDKSATL